MDNSLSKSTSLLGWRMIIQLYAKAIPRKGVTISPLSVSFALAMLAGGASVDTRIELCSKLGIEDPDELNTVLSNILETFSTGSDSKMLSIANAVFADRSFMVFPNYIKHIDIFHAYLKSDFPTLMEGTDEINEWISNNTNGMIKNMLSPSNLRQSHVALVNALAFKGIWQNQFDPKNTRRNYPFRGIDDSRSSVSMMFLNNPKILVYNGRGYKAVRLLYTASSKSSNMSFIAYLPNEDKTLQETLQTIQDQGIPRFSERKLHQLGFPKFDVKTSLEIFPMLKELGYPLSGNFPEMGEGPSQIEAILHNAVIHLDEHGTEAAAATVIVMTRSLPTTPPPTIIFDRPFAFSIVLDSMELVVFNGIFTVD
jgi:serine protease inhibitor